ncbi:jg17692 [Pararge aegeria aegeria]|uniref:Jg17692 protein n=1 Tax=Pararge aegeria aegeria TaxID=348720 RepID=A0A8S4QHT6_9NEOP|nr:jg17692 [Pararge aegeria aegeria]
MESLVVNPKSKPVFGTLIFLHSPEQPAETIWYGELNCQLVGMVPKSYLVVVTTLLQFFFYVPDPQMLVDLIVLDKPRGVRYLFENRVFSSLDYFDVGIAGGAPEL